MIHAKLRRPKVRETLWSEAACRRFQQAATKNIKHAKPQIGRLDLCGRRHIRSWTKWRQAGSLQRGFLCGAAYSALRIAIARIGTRSLPAVSQQTFCDNYQHFLTLCDFISNPISINLCIKNESLFEKSPRRFCRKRWTRC